MSESLTTYLTVLLRWWRVAAAITLIGVIAAAGYLVMRPNEYQSSAVLFVSTPRDDANTYYRGDTYSKERITSYAALGKSPEIADRVINDVMLDQDAASVVEGTKLVPIPETVLLNLTTTGRTPREAQAICTAYVEELRRSIAALETVPGALTPRAELIPVQPPSYPTVRAGFSHWLILGAAAGLALILGCFAIVLVALLDGRIRRPADASEATGAPVLAEFASPVSWNSSGTDAIAGESARSLRTALDRLTVLGGRIVMVASAEGGAGKTGTALSISRTLADRGSSVALIDFDARHSTLAQTLNLSDDLSVRQLIANESLQGYSNSSRHRSPGEAVVGALPDVNWEGVAVVPFGDTEDNPGASADSPRIVDMFAALRERYEWVIVDTPAINEFSDATQVVRHCDTAVLVVQAGRTGFDKLRVAAEELTRAGGHVSGVVFVASSKAPTPDETRSKETTQHQNTHASAST